MLAQSDVDLREVLAFRRIAVVGASRYPGKAAHDVPRYMASQGYEIIPVNPNAETVLERPAFNSLGSVDESVEVVNVFRPSDEVAGIVDKAIDRGDVQAIWLQLGITDKEAIDRAIAAGLTVVEDRCIMVEHRRLMDASARE